MFYRTLLLSVIAAAVSAPLLVGQSVSLAADNFIDKQKVFHFHAKNAIVLGQDSTSNAPAFGSRFKNWVNRFLQDAEFEDPPQRPEQEPQSLPVVQPAVPATPPKPLTAAEVQQSAAANQRRAGTAPQTRQGNGNRQTPMPPARDTVGRESAAQDSAGNGEQENMEDSIHARMNKYRQAVLAHPALEEAAHHSRQSNSTLSPFPVSTLPTADNSAHRSIETPNIDAPIVPAVPSPAATSPVPAAAVPLDGTTSSLTPSVVTENPQRIPHSDPIAVEPIPAGQTLTGQNLAGQTALSNMTMIAEQPSESVPVNQLVVSESPRYGLEIEKPQVSVVGQEVTYRIRFSNTGNVPIEQVVLSTEIPSWIDLRHAEATNGKAEPKPRDDGSGISDLTWRMSRVESGMTDLLILRLIPQQQRPIELAFHYDYYKPALVAKVDIQEPKLELELLGSDEVLWNDLVAYTLLVRNVGNGNADNLKLTLLQTNSDAAECPFEEPLCPGEEQPITITVQAGKDQEFIDIAVQAEASHDVRGEVKRRIRVLRPKLELSVQTPAFHFVENPAVFTIRVRNMGSADAENMTIRAELPLGAQYESSSEGGVLTTQSQQGVVEWRGRSIVRGETQTFLLTCLPRREGECRVSVETCDPLGTVMASGNSTFTAEAFGELDLAVLKPKGHVELGQEAEYTIQVTNIGTKAAENVEVSMAFGWKDGTDSVAVLEPINVAGGEASLYNGMVTFEKIPVILPKQSVELKVIAKAEQAGTVAIKTQASGKEIAGVVGSELSTTVFSRQSKVATTSDSSSPNEVQ